MSKDQNYVSSLSVALMIAQIRAKQLATKTTQDNLQKMIKKSLEVNDSSGEVLIKTIQDNLSKWMVEIDLLKDGGPDNPFQNIGNAGFPIKFNKTSFQLKMLSDWIEDKGDAVIGNLGQGVFYNSLTNSIDQLPQLQADNQSSFWGNENSSVTTVLLWSVASTLGLELNKENFFGAGTFYPFFNYGYSINPNPNNPFLYENGVMLFGEYQFGGHRYFSNSYPNLGQRLFSPEDCSSSVGKATLLTEGQIVGINTKAITESYKNPSNEYCYTPVVSSAEGVVDLEKINQGDIYLRGSHVAIISGILPDSTITSLEFNRDIDPNTNAKMLGGGSYQYDLESKEKPFYILRPQKAGQLHESTPIDELLGRIDAKYHEIEYVTDVIGDFSQVFLG
ncbi:MAG: hypothetical protein RLZZ59_643 [Pseudomonadota bacterium]|jgi:hypothetical protein